MNKIKKKNRTNKKLFKKKKRKENDTQAKQNIFKE